MVHGSSRRSTYGEHITSYRSDQEMNGRPHFAPDMGTSSIRSCRSASLMRQQSSCQEFESWQKREWRRSMHGENYCRRIPQAKVSWPNHLVGNYGLHPRFNISLPTTSVNPSAEDRARILEELHHDLSLELSLASERYKKQADRHRSATPHFVVWRHGLVVTSTHLYYSSMCKTWLQEVGTILHCRVHQSRLLQTRPSIPLLDSRFFSCLPPRTPLCFATLRMVGPSTTTYAIDNRGRITRSTKSLTRVGTIHTCNISSCGRVTPCLTPRGNHRQIYKISGFSSLISPQIGNQFGKEA